LAVVAVALWAAFALGDAGDAMLAGASRSAAPTERVIHVGQIYINGADDMSASAILNELGFQTGDRIPFSRLREAEHRLDRLGLFVVDKAKGARPVIAELPDGEFTDLRITVRLRTRP
jgi:outer membrane protein assembly factor BamA